MKQPIYNKSDFSKGQKVYLLICEGSNAARHIMDKNNIDNWVSEAIVTSIGRKYITVSLDNYSEVRFDITDDFLQYTTYGSRDYILFSSKQESLEAKELEILYREVRKCFSYYSCPFTLNQIKAIRDIIGKD